MTSDHEQIRRWAEERGGRPSCVRGTGGGGDTGMLRIDFPGFTGEDSLEEITWDEFFDKFDERNLALLYQDETSRGERSNFNKLVSRETADDVRSGEHRRGRGGSTRGSSSGSTRSSSSRNQSRSSGSGRGSAKKSGGGRGSHGRGAK